MNDENKRISSILALLQNAYPNAHIMLTYTSPWELLVSVILSAQCTDIMVNKVTPPLFARYPTMKDVARARQGDVEQVIRPTGFYRNKTKHIIAAASTIQKSFHGQVPKTMGELLTITGVARKTANVVLANAYNSTPGIAVDTHVIRVSQRLRLVPLEKIGGKKRVFVERNGTQTVDFIKDADPIKIERQLMEIIPKKDWKVFAYQVIDHGRTICKAVRPDCKNCVLSSLCPVARI